MSHNGLTGVSATGLSFTNTMGGYRILGNGLSLDSGGIADNPGGTSTQINAPLNLTANQTWTIGGGFGPAYDSLSIIGAVTGSSFTVAVPFVPFTSRGGGGSSGDLFVTSDMEAGAVTVTGAGSLHIGGSVGNGSVNGTNGNPVTISQRARLIANPNSKVGALSVATGSKLLLGTGKNNVGAVKLNVNGGLSIDSSAGTNTRTYISNNGSTPGTDFSQASATGNVTLGGQLILAQGPSGGGCVTLSRGDVATLFTTTFGTLSGTFAGVANGAIIPMAAVSGSCPSPPQVQISYTANSVTATVMNGTTPTTTTLATPSPSPAVNNQPVALTATVTTTNSGTVAPAGTVTFASSGTAIPGCTARPVTPTGGSNGTATCTTSFSAASSPESLTAAFTGTTASGQGSSISRPQVLTVTPQQVSATTSPATHVGTSRATLNGSIATGGRSVSWKFEYGRRMAYGRTTPVQTISGGRGTIAVSSVLKRLSPDARYHYRLVVSAAGQTVNGRGVTFTTRATGSLRFSARRLSVLGRRILVSEKCQSKVLCIGRFSLTTKVRVGKKKLATVVCASQGFRIKAHRTASTRARLSGACLRLLRPHGRLTVRYTARTRTGQKGVSRRVTLVLR